MPKNFRFIIYATILGLALYAYFQPRPDLRGPAPSAPADSAPVVATPAAPALPPPPEISIPVTDRLGVRREGLETSFSQAPFKYAFQFATDAEGRSQLTGTAPDGTAHLVMIGPPEAVTGAALRADMNDSNRLAQLKNANAMVNLAKLAVPGWSEATAWVTDNIQRTLAVGSAATTVDGKDITMTARPPGKILILMITGPKS
ncbi:MAG: hypothetical protein KDE14_10445 [Rhodobacteraceae bacterium]|nr:hypothetical protein [Paracoccaceae bacterium]